MSKIKIIFAQKLSFFHCQAKDFSVHVVKSIFHHFNLQVVNFIPNKLNKLIRNGKDTLKKENNTGIVYKINCKQCKKHTLVKQNVKQKLDSKNIKLI